MRYFDRDNRNRALTVVAIILIFIGAFYRMNTRFDRLSRYPYDNEEARQLIDEYLDDDAIDYIIEYSIEPNYFIDLITAPGFNIYHVDYYRSLIGELDYLTKEEVVAFAEKVMTYENGQETASALLHSYSSWEILFWLENGDPYYPDAVIAASPDALNIVLDDQHTIADRIPLNLTELGDLVDAECEEGIQVRREMAEDLNNVCSLMEEHYGRSCGGMKIVKGYVNYGDIAAEYSENSSIAAPGHNEHQTGLAIDVSFSGNEALAAEKEAFLKENLNSYGFVTYDYGENENIHLRYCSKNFVHQLKK